MRRGIPRIVLTGGPGGGKSTLMGELREEDPSADRWLLVPEAAPLLFRAGLDPRGQAFQAAVVQVQLALEDACAASGRPGQALVCHRGGLDPLAYWLRNGWEEGDFFALTGRCREEYLCRYEGVIQLQTTAIDAEAYYRRVPDAHRPETPAQAIEIDVFCARAWGAHPRYVLIENAGREWPAKSRAAHEQLEGMLAAHAARPVR